MESRSTGEALWNYTVTFIAPQGLSEDGVEVAFGAEFNAKPLPPHLNEAMEERWASKTASNPTLFNGLKFRCAGHRADSGAEGGAHLYLDVGLTDYKRYLATNAAGQEQVCALMEAASAAGLDRYAFLANPIGIDVVCRTSDGMLVVLRRSAQVFEHAGTWALVGGHPEPYMMLHAALGAPASPPDEHPTQEQVLDAHHRWLDSQRQLGNNVSSGRLVVNELFDSVLRELEEELGLSKDLLRSSPSVLPSSSDSSYNVHRQCRSSALLLGMFTPNWVQGKVDLVFLVETNITFAQLSSIYDKGAHQDAFEHDDFSGFTEEQVQIWISEIDEGVAIGKDMQGKSKMSPYCRATLDIYLRARAHCRAQ